MMRPLLLLFCLLLSISCGEVASNSARDYYILGREAQYEKHDLVAALQYYAHAEALVSSGASELDKNVYVDMLNDFAVLLLPHDASSARKIFERIISIAPTHLSALVNLAGLLDTSSAEVYYQRALAAHPFSGPLHYNYGVFQYKLHNSVAALHHWQLAVDLSGESSSTSLAAANIATLHCQGNNMTAAETYYKFAISHAVSSDYYGLLFQQHTSVLPILMASAQHIRQVRTSFLTNLIDLVLQIPISSIPDPDNHLGCSSLGYYAIYHGHNDMLLRRLYSTVMRIASPEYVEGPVYRHNTQHSSIVDRKIKVGFLSGFFYHHSVGLLMQGVITHLDRKKFEISVIIFHDMPTHDHVTNNILFSADRVVVLSDHIHDSRNTIRSLALDILVFSEIGMHSQTYFLAHSCLAKTTAVFWGHAVTSGISSEFNGTCAPNYFISSTLFEASAAAQCKYTERLLLLQGITTYFLPPDPPLSFSELMSSGQVDAKERIDYGTRDWSVRNRLKKVQFLRYLFDCDGYDITNDNSRRKVCGDELFEERRLYGIPQTLYKLSPQFIHVIYDVLRVDSEGWIVLPAGQDTSIAETALKNLQSVLDPDAFIRVILVRPMKGREFITLCSIFDVVLDTYPVGGGRSSFEIFSVGTPIVVLNNETSILQLTAGMYKVMGLNCCVVNSKYEYAKLAFEIASNPVLSKQLRSDILKYKYRLYSNHSVITEWERMLLYIHNKPHDQYSQVIPGVSSYCEHHRSEYNLEVEYGLNEYSLALSMILKHHSVSSYISSVRIDLMHSLLRPTYDVPALSLPSLVERHEIMWQQLRLFWEKDGKSDVIYEVNFENVIAGETLSIAIRNIDVSWQEQLYDQLTRVSDRLKLYFIAAVVGKEVNRILTPVINRLPVTFHLADEDHNETILYDIIVRSYDTSSELMLRLLNDNSLHYVPFDAISRAVAFLSFENSGTSDAIDYRRSMSSEWLLWNNDERIHSANYFTPLAPLSTFTPSKSHIRLDDRITLGITTSKRLSHFQRTLSAMLPTIRYLRDIKILHEILIVDDASSVSDRAAMQAEIGDEFTLVLKPRHEKGHANSMNFLIDRISTKYLLYIEDDWLVIPNPLLSSSLATAIVNYSTAAPVFAQLIMAARDILSTTELSAEPVHEILFNEQSQRECSLGSIVSCDADALDDGGWQRKIMTSSNSIPYQLHEFALPPMKSRNRDHFFSTWPGFSLNPGIWNLQALHEMTGGSFKFNESDVAFEQRATLELYGAGWRMGYMASVALQHIGDVSSYALNNVSRPFDRV